MLPATTGCLINDVRRNVSVPCTAVLSFLLKTAFMSWVAFLLALLMKVCLTFVYLCATLFGDIVAVFCDV